MLITEHTYHVSDAHIPFSKCKVLHWFNANSLFKAALSSLFAGVKRLHHWPTICSWIFNGPSYRKMTIRPAGNFFSDLIRDRKSALTPPEPIPNFDHRKSSEFIAQLESEYNFGIRCLKNKTGLVYDHMDRYPFARRCNCKRHQRRDPSGTTWIIGDCRVNAKDYKEV